ncbi:BQ2448_3087 [Microbotryum intermedium]|uniref:BQ2448_3087 protein n=1 Tax=Microbotryum intermedium TaxID=269621 RepID=A0A238FFD5_9BASI|nr:BQ2448_3087 [Microbotryum intermedium]
MACIDEGRFESDPLSVSSPASQSQAQPHATSVVSHGATSSGSKEPTQLVVTQDMERWLDAGSSSPCQSLFTELLQVDEPIPSQQELEDAGVFDLEATSQRLAEWRGEHRQSLAVAQAHGSSSPSGRGAKCSSCAQDVTNSSEKCNTVSSSFSWEVVDDSEQAFCTSPSTSPRMLAFAFVRKAIRPGKPVRTQSTPVFSDHTNTPFLSPIVSSATATNPWEQSLARHRPTSSGYNGASCDVSSTASTLKGAVAVNGPSKPNRLRKSRPPGLTIRLDVDHPNAPASSTAMPTRSPNPSLLSNSPKSPSSIKRQWRRSLPFLLTSPIRAQSDILDASGYIPNRSPSSPGPTSPAAAHPLSRRGSSRKKRGSVSSSDEGHLGDAEEVAAARSGRDGSRESALSSSSLWGLRLGRASASNAHLRVPNGERSRMVPERRVEGEGGADPNELGGSPTKRSFEVLHRPTVGRSRSANAVFGERHDLSNRPKSIGGVLSEAASTSSPNLSKIDEEENGSLFSLTASASKRSPSLRLGRNRPDSSDDESTEYPSTRTRPSSIVLRPTSRTHSPVPSSHLHHVVSCDSSLDSDEDDDPRRATYQTFPAAGARNPSVHEHDGHTRVSSSFTSNRPRSLHHLSNGGDLLSESDSSTLTSSSNWEHDQDEGNDTPASSAQLGESDLETDDDFGAFVIDAKRLESIPIEGGEVIGWQ